MSNAKPDADIRKDVLAELEWDPAIDPTHVGVAVRDGVVTVTGHLDTYAEKYAVQRAVQVASQQHQARHPPRVTRGVGNGDGRRFLHEYRQYRSSLRHQNHGVGIGFFIWDAWNSSRIPDIVVALVYIGLVGFALDRMVAFVATRVTRGTAAN